MIINANGVNVDTNTMRTNSEIINLINSNSMTKTLLRTLNVSSTSTSSRFGEFTLTSANVREYTQLYITFNGNISTTSASGSAGINFRIWSGESYVTLARLEAYPNYPATLYDFSILLEGGSLNEVRTSNGTTTTSRSYGVNNINGVLTLNGSQCSFSMSALNSVGNVSINGTIYIYGIK